MLVQYDELEQGLIEKPRRDPTVPYWAIWNTPSYALKNPSAMIVFVQDRQSNMVITKRLLIGVLYLIMISLRKLQTLND